VSQARTPGALPILIDSARKNVSTDHVGLHKLLIETVRDYAIFVLDPEGRVLTWNPGAQALKGYTRGRNCWSTLLEVLS
jgi:PAS domain-containing protein